MKRTWYRALIGLGCCVIAIFGIISTGGTTQAAANPDPTVVVVRDSTPLGCLERRGLLQGTTWVTTSTFACPAGTRMSLVQVLLSEAKANHEAYVVMPSQSSSRAEQDAAMVNIQALAKAANATFQSANSVVPLSSCSPRTQYLAIYNGNTAWDSQNKYDMNVDYDTHSDCSVYIHLSAITGEYIHSYFYWGWDLYASWQSPKLCTPVTNGTKGWNPNTTHNSGYYYEQWMYSGSNCTVFDHDSYYNVGPLYP